jgi:hypothetical protein
MKEAGMRSKGIAVLAAAAMALAAPVAFANPGGVPNNPHGKPCPSKAVGHAQGPNITEPNPGKGRKCGFHRTTNSVTTVTP